MNGVTRTESYPISLEMAMILLAREDDALKLFEMQDTTFEIKQTAQERKAWREEQIKKIGEAFQKNKQIDGWSMFLKVVSIAAGFFSIVGGAALCATGAGVVGGALMIVAGTVTLGSQLAQETGVTRIIAEKAFPNDSKRAEKLLRQIDLGLNISCMVISVGAGIASATSVAHVAEKAVGGTIQGFSAGADGIGTIGQSIAQKDLSHVQAVVFILSAKIDQADRDTKRLKQDMSDKLEKVADIAVDHFEGRTRKNQILYAGGD